MSDLRHVFFTRVFKNTRCNDKSVLFGIVIPRKASSESAPLNAMVLPFKLADKTYNRIDILKSKQFPER